MVHAKNYETVFTFVEDMQRKRWPLFSGHGVHTYLLTYLLTYAGASCFTDKSLSKENILDKH